MYVCHIVWFEHILSKFSNIRFHVMGYMKTIVMQPFFCLFVLNFWTHILQTNKCIQITYKLPGVRRQKHSRMEQRRGGEIHEQEEMSWGSPVLQEKPMISILTAGWGTQRKEEITIARMWKQPRCSTDEWIKKMW